MVGAFNSLDIVVHCIVVLCIVVHLLGATNPPAATLQSAHEITPQNTEIVKNCASGFFW